MQIIMALISGVVFGVGLTIAGMLDPSKISGFLEKCPTRTPSRRVVIPPFLKTRYYRVLYW